MRDWKRFPDSPAAALVSRGLRGGLMVTKRREGQSRGFGAVGSALPWHGRGQGFESPKLHPPKVLVTASDASAIRHVCARRDDPDSQNDSQSHCAPSLKIASIVRAPLVSTGRSSLR